jgi:hypothetical protein
MPSKRRKDSVYHEFGPDDLQHTVIHAQPLVTAVSGTNGWRSNLNGPSGSLSLYEGVRARTDVSPATTTGLLVAPIDPIDTHSIDKVFFVTGSYPSTGSLELVKCRTGPNPGFSNNVNGRDWYEEHWRPLELLYQYYGLINPEFVTASYDYYSVYFKQGSSGKAPLISFSGSLLANMTSSFTVSAWVKPSFVTASTINMVANSSFETDTDGDGYADYWGQYANLATSGALDSVVTMTPGTKSQRFMASGSAVNPRIILNSNRVQVTSGTMVTISAWFTASAGGNAAQMQALLVMKEFSVVSGGLEIGQYGPVSPFLTSSGFSRVVSSAVVVRDGFLAPNLGLNNASPSSSVWVDNVQIEIGPSASAYAPMNTNCQDFVIMGQRGRWKFFITGSTGQLAFSDFQGGAVAGSSSLTPGIWQHVAMVNSNTPGGSRVNNLKQSQVFSSAIWNHRGTAQAQDNAILSPDGAMNGTKISGIGLAGTNDMWQTVTFSNGANGNLFLPSFWIKKLSATQTGTLGIANPTGGAGGGFSLDLSLLGADWTRVWPRHPAASFGAYPNLLGTSGGLHFNFAGGGVIGFYLFGAQCEPSTSSLDSPTPYIRTTDVAVATTAGSGSTQFYINAQPAGSPVYNGILSPGTGTMAVSGNFLAVGAEYAALTSSADLTENGFCGFIHETRVWSAARSPVAMSATFLSNLTGTLPQELVHYARYNDGPLGSAHGFTPGSGAFDFAGETWNGRTNLISYSQQFDVFAAPTSFNTFGTWSAGNLALAPDTTVAPDGTVTGDAIWAVITGSTAGISQRFWANGGPYAASVYLQISSGTYTGTGFNLSIWDETRNQHMGTATVVGGTFVAGGGWQRLTTFTTSSYAGHLMRLFIYPLGSSAGVGTPPVNVTASMWGAMVEEGTISTGAYIPTSGSYVTVISSGSAVHGQFVNMRFLNSPIWQPNDNALFSPIKARVVAQTASMVRVLHLPSMMYGRQVATGTLQMTCRAYDNQGIVRTIVDDGRGGLYMSGSNLRKISGEDVRGVAWRKVGNIFYAEGLAVITDPSLLDFGNYLEGDWSQNSDPLEVRFRGDQRINTKVFMCRLGQAQAAGSNNPTYSWVDSRGTPVTTDDVVRIKGSQPLTYVTAIGIYNEERQLVAVAKIAQPIRKREKDKLNIKLKMDF